MPIVNDIIAWENGSMTPEQERKFFQKMVNDGSVWSLQGMYGRRAQELLNNGEIDYPKKQTHDYYGNPIPTQTAIAKQFGSYVPAARRRKLKEVS